MAFAVEESSRGVILPIWAQPGASREAVVGIQGDYLKIAIKAKAVEGAANKALVAFLSRALSLPKRTIRIASGERGRRKRILLEGVAATEIEGFLAPWRE